MTNIEKSERVISIILTTLIDRGIQDGLVDFSDLVGDDELKPFVGSCFRWLMSEGIVSVAKDISTDDGVAAIDPTLTSYGFNLMGNEVTLEGRKTDVGDVVRQVAQSGKTFSNIGELLGSALGAFTKSVG